MSEWPRGSSGKVLPPSQVLVAQDLQQSRLKQQLAGGLRLTLEVEMQSPHQGFPTEVPPASDSLPT